MSKIRLFSAFILVGAVTTLPACRFGNKVVNQENPDTITGYYESAPATLKFCATLEGVSSPICQSIPQESINNHVPELIYQVMSNPVAFVVRVWETGDSYIFNPFGGNTLLPLFLNADTGRVTLLANNDPPPPLWGYDDCRHGFSLSADGFLVQGEAKTLNGLTTKGNLQIEYVVIDKFKELSPGACGTAAADMKSCYFDHTTCGGSNETENLSLQQNIRNFFLPYVAASVIAPSQIHDIRSLVYEVSYQ